MRFTRSCRGGYLFFVCALSFCLVLMLSNTRAGAQTGFGSIEIIVSDTNNVPLPGAKLCLQMSNQVMERQADQDGRYVTSLPAGQTTVYAKKDGYENRQETVAMANGQQLVRQLRLPPGQTQPFPIDCGTTTATTTTPAEDPCDTIASLLPAIGTRVTNREVAVTLNFKNSTNAYRITEFSPQEVLAGSNPSGWLDPGEAFTKKNVKWTPVINPASTSATINFTLTEPGYGNHTIYVQTRRYSNGCVARRTQLVTVVLAPSNFQTHTLKGPALEQFVTEAKARGYEFRTQMNVFQRADRCRPGFYSLWPENFNNPRAPLGGDKNRLDQEVTAKFEVFGGPLLLRPFWTIEQSKAEHPNFPNYVPPGPLDPNRNNTVMVYEKFGQSGCPHGCQQSPTREFSWVRKIYGYVALSGTRAQGGTEFCDRERDASLTELVLRGPAGDNPVSALEDLRIQRPFQLRPIPPPKLIIPRGIEGEQGTDGSQPMDQPVEPGKNP
ncbi:MAG: carboxypeptidase-like regulatory domain-containing protein [Nitrospira sp.]|nr:carboxypeptidase-like regulatory domain-containing protein [Nitrospira sp.]